MTFIASFASSAFTEPHIVLCYFQFVMQSQFLLLDATHIFGNNRFGTIALLLGIHFEH